MARDSYIEPPEQAQRRFSNVRPPSSGKGVSASWDMPPDMSGQHMSASTGGSFFDLMRSQAGVSRGYIYQYTQPSSGMPLAAYARTVNALVRRVDTLEQRILKESVGYIKINLLRNRILSPPLDAVVEPDDDGFIARTPDIPLYGYGDDPMEAVDALKCEIQSLYDELMEDDALTDEWLTIKEFLRKRIVHR